MTKIRVAIADDQHLFRQGLITLFNNAGAFEVVAEAGDGRAFLEAIQAPGAAPDIALIDMDMPGMNGIELNAALQKDFPAVKTIVLSVHSQERFIAKMIDAGASGYLLKNCDVEELFNAIHTVYKSGFYINHHVLQSIRHAALHRNKPLRNINNIPVELTGREKEILQLICREYSNVEIAQALFLSIRTVEGHRNNLLAKTGCRNTAGMVLFAVRHGIVDPGF